jgi:hypothetical protein
MDFLKGAATVVSLLAILVSFAGGKEERTLSSILWNTSTCILWIYVLMTEG